MKVCDEECLRTTRELAERTSLLFKHAEREGRLEGAVITLLAICREFAPGKVSKELSLAIEDLLGTPITTGEDL